MKAKVAKLKEEIGTLEFNISKENLKNSEVVGDYIIYKNPLRPKGKLIIFLSFLMGFVFSVFSVFLLESVSRRNIEGT